MWLVLAAALLGQAAPSLSSNRPSPRPISVTLVTDQGFRALANWRGLARGVVAKATQDLAGDAGLRFTVDAEVAWESPDSVQSLEDLLRAAREQAGSSDGLTAVFLGARSVGPGDRGFAYLGKPALLVVSPGPHDLEFGLGLPEHLALYFRHELGHVFGIPHLRGANVMNPVPQARVFEFGELGSEILRANRNMRFDAGGPFTGCDLASLRDVYLLLFESGQMEISLLVDLGLALEREGDLASSQVVLEKALERDPKNAVAWHGLGRVRFKDGDTLGAKRAFLHYLEHGPAGTARDEVERWLERLGR